MLKLVLRGIRANLGRLFMTLISVVLGVACVSGSFILADSLRSVFNSISEDAFAGVDAQVRAVTGDLNSDQIPPRFDEAILGDIQELPGVNYAEAGLFAFEQVYALDSEGLPIRPQGPPVFTASWGGESPVSSFKLLEGSAPVGQQVVLDLAQIDQGGFTVGQNIEMSLPAGESETFELVGALDFGDGGTGGAYFIAFDLPTAQRLLGAEGLVDSIVVNADGGLASDELLADISAILPVGLETLSGAEVIDESKEQFGSFIDIFGYILLSFAGVILFVSIFIIRNTFAILVGQRTRQLGLLRSIGASASQVRRMVLSEAIVIGLLASAIGLVGGIGIAALLKWLFSQGGGGFPDGPTEIRLRTILVVVAVGLGVTVISALIPAFRAGKVSPLEAIRDGGSTGRSLNFRIIAGAAVLIPGLIALFAGMFTTIESTSSRLTAIGSGAILTFIGVAMLSGLFAGMVSYKIGAPLEQLTGISGRIGRENAARNPERTAATASALMIGLALITGVAVVASSILRTFDELLEDAITADLFIFEEAQGLEFSPVLIDRLSEIPEVEAAAGFSDLRVNVLGEPTGVTAFNTEVGDSVINYGAIDGDGTISESGIGVFSDVAETAGLAVGDSVTVEFQDGFSADLTVETIFDDNTVLDSDWILNIALAEQHADVRGVGFAGVTYVDGADPDTVRAEIDSLLAAGFPQLTSQDNTEFQEEITSQINQLQLIVSGLLFMCLIVAFFGIVNTMALSVLERTREIGLLRAVGMTRQQLKSTIRSEAVIVSLFGSFLGVAMGLLLGWAGVTAIPDSFISKVGIPWVQLGLFVIGGGILGIIAAFFPGARAAKMNVLDAIATD